MLGSSSSIIEYYSRGAGGVSEHETRVHRNRILLFSLRRRRRGRRLRRRTLSRDRRHKSATLKGGGGGVHLDSHQFSVVIYYYTCGFITRPTKKKRKEAGKRRINE